MKKTHLALGFVLAALTAGTGMAYGQDSSEGTETYEYRTIFYGTEAQNNVNNPCKGATYRKCAEMDIQLSKLSLNHYYVVETTTGVDGEVLGTNNYEFKGSRSEFEETLNTCTFPGQTIVVVP